MAGEKRSNNSDEVVQSETTILLDVEGTTTSISFVKEELFPYVRNNLKKYLDENWDKEEFKADLEKLKDQANKDEKAKIAGFQPISGTSPEEEKESLVKNILWQMDEDRKTGALKQLQGHIWRQAFESGDIKGHVFDDVPKALESWTNGGRKIYIYSSGSVEAQKLLFSHSRDKDLTKFLSGYFDTEVGIKNEVDSYRNILNKINVPASSVLFLTDVVKEAKAAKEAGMSTTIVIREGNAPLNEEDKSTFSTIKSFDELCFQSVNKRQKVDSVEDIKDSEVEEVSKSEPIETGIDSKSQVPIKNDDENVVEPMDVSEESLAKIEEKAEAILQEENEMKDVVEVEQCEKKSPSSEISKEETPKLVTEDSKESKNTESEKPKEECTKVEEKKDEETIAKESDEILKVEKVNETEKPVDESVKQSVAEKKSEIEPAKAKESQNTDPTPESKTDEKEEEKVETTPEISTKSKETIVTEEKVINKNENKDQSPKTKETTEELKKDVPEKTIEIEKEKATESETKDSKVDVKENGEAKKTEEKEQPSTEAEIKKDQPELRSDKAEEEKNEKKEEDMLDKSKEEEKEEKVTEVEKAKEDENKFNGTSNGKEKHSNGVEENNKSDSNTSKASSSQNGEAEVGESSEAIKVKKVVDPTVADGAGEPEVVTPPVAVAATS
ncbi:enolase-phosphatase E1-like [Leptopilina heterotoma]|uniref:enolase-phosphatase E1-like n=1 Tax=Leptopilina heterotoma TaxID=63436 RepID=UPI001CA7F2BE|nr:enolase-phosphatase E1-like [Leptopilina heterotoma]